MTTQAKRCLLDATASVSKSTPVLIYAKLFGLLSQPFRTGRRPPWPVQPPEDVEPVLLQDAFVPAEAGRLHIQKV